MVTEQTAFTIKYFYGFALGSSFLLSFLIFIPFCRWLALKLDIVDKPGGRKEHLKVTPLLGGLGVFLASVVTFLLLVYLIDVWTICGVDSRDLDFSRYTAIFIGGIIVFLTGILDDVIKRKKELAYYYKLIGQVAAILLAMLVVAREPMDRILAGEEHIRDYVYLLFFLLWLLTTINSFNYSDNINGLMSGLAVIVILLSIVYLKEMDNKCIFLGFILVGSMLGFIPFNFPRGKIFIGDAGSMFVGYWVGMLTWPLTKGLLDPLQNYFGLDYLIAPFLMMGVPLFDACLVLIFRLKEGRPVYLGDNQHLSHRLVRSGFSVTETALLLWGTGLILGGMGAIAYSFGETDRLFRFVAFVFAIAFLICATLLVLRAEKRGIAAAAENS